MQVPVYDKASLDEECAEMDYDIQMREILEGMTRDITDPDAEHSSALFAECKNLRKFYLDIAVGKETPYISWLTCLPGLHTAEIAFKDASHWEVQARDPKHYFDSWICTYLEEVYLGEVDVNPLGLAEGVVRVIKVDIMPPLRLGYESREERLLRWGISPNTSNG
ncbi:MAG: hypothetical protein Q9164_002636 [Protoblastenia rupestris]